MFFYLLFSFLLFYLVIAVVLFFLSYLKILLCSFFTFFSAIEKKSRKNKVVKQKNRAARSVKRGIKIALFSC